MDANKKRITFEMSEEQHRDLKLAAFMAGKSLKDLLLEGVDQARKLYSKEIKQAKEQTMGDKR